ncbi:hypothetical protein I3842_16G090600 [Carya illinoinensis]|uniref:Uncharacterized protein n=1 Tax=Carya illinoinensis TaxID=32201 RepID=A0A922D185_CARIL|nr:hypothetical protein I3842_16G090600 [Carya illinoinensis]
MLGQRAQLSPKIPPTYLVRANFWCLIKEFFFLPSFSAPLRSCTLFDLERIFHHASIEG